MKYLRTPDARFDGLEDYDFSPNYLTVDDTEGGRLRMHYVDEGPADAAPVLLLHGEPTWSYLYRHMIPVFTAHGCRVVAPDLIGFGRSDKPTERSDYTYQRHVDWLTEALVQLDLTGITLVCQDWGGLLGLRLVADMPDRFARIVVANTALPTGDQPMSDAFLNWRELSQQVPELIASAIVDMGTVSAPSDGARVGYDAPFPDETYKAGARHFPMLVPTTPDDPASEPNRQAWAVLSQLRIPVLTAFGAQDEIMAGVDVMLQQMLPGAAGQDHTVLQGAGHFIQEDAGPDLAAVATAFIDKTS